VYGCRPRSGTSVWGLAHLGRVRSSGFCKSLQVAATSQTMARTAGCVGLYSFGSGVCSSRIAACRCGTAQARALRAELVERLPNARMSPFRADLASYLHGYVARSGDSAGADHRRTRTSTDRTHPAVLAIVGWLPQPASFCKTRCCEHGRGERAPTLVPDGPATIHVLVPMLHEEPIKRPWLAKQSYSCRRVARRQQPAPDTSFACRLLERLVGIERAATLCSMLHGYQPTEDTF